jgi:hypothetical protein
VDTNKIRLYKDTPEFIKPEISRFLNALNPLVPDWCSHVWVSWRANDSDNESTVADITAFYDYRWARLTIYASWLEQTEEFKREALTHELMHLFIAPLSDYARDTIKLLIPPDEAEKFSKAMVEQIRERCESVTQDLTRLVLDGHSVRGVPSDEREAMADAQT